MSFAYTEDLTLARDFVRFHTGDVIQAQSFLSDEIIASLVSVTGSKEAAVIAALKHIITRLSQPNFSADWLEVDYATAREAYERLLAEKKRELGYGSIVGATVQTYRVDSNQTSDTDWAGSDT